MCLAGLVALAVPAAQPAAAAAADPTELAYWQSIENSQDVSDYRDYLKQFPAGVFAPIAQSRIRKLEAGGTVVTGTAAGTAGTAPGTSAPAPATQPATQEDQNLGVTPASIHVGEQVKVTFKDVPKPGSGYPDLVVVTRAGSPDDHPTQTRDDRRLYASVYINIYYSQGYVMLGPFPPGNYEARYVTTLWSDDQSYQVHSRAPFTVR